MRQKPWDEFETALLIEAYQKIKIENANKDITLAKLSDTLRELAKKNGIRIDNTYRNVNGMHWQFGYIERAFKGEDFEQRHQAKVFVNMVNMFKSNHEAYEKILNEAHDVLSNKNVKNQFINWLSNRFVGNTTTNEIANLIEDVFFKYCDLCVWNITENKLYTFLINDISSNYKFKNISRQIYKDFFKYEFLYSDFLRKNKTINYQKEATKISAVLDSNKYYEELEKINQFFNDKYRTDFFSKAFLYSKQQDSKIQLDVRSTIIGLSVENERLRYYSDKKGTIKIKLSKKDRYTVNMSDIDIDAFFQLIDFSNKYIENNRAEMAIGSTQKNRQEESEKTFETKSAHDNSVETDFYNYLKDEYLANHENDGKAKRAPYHVQRSISFINQINTVLDENHIDKRIFEIHEVLEINEIIKFVKNHQNEFDEADYKWYLYVLGMYRSFLKKNQNKRTIVNLEEEHSTNVNNEYIKNDYIQIIEEHYPDGLSYRNPLRKKRFEQIYVDLYHKEFSDSLDNYYKKLISAGFESEGKIYPPTIISEDLKNRIKNTIDNVLAKGPKIVYYQPLFLFFKKEINVLFDDNMFKSYLKHVFQNEYRFEKQYLQDKEYIYDLKQILIDFYKEIGEAANIERIYKEFPYIANNAIDEVIGDEDFIVNYRGKSYFYYGIFEITSEQIEKIKGYISNKIAEVGQVSRSEIYAFIEENVPSLLETNPSITELGIKNILRKFLNNEFNFSGDVISAQGEQLDVKTLYENFCKERETFSLADLEEFKSSIHKTYIDYEAIFDNCVRINKNTYLRKDKIEFDITVIDEAISVYCNKDFISFSDVVNYNDFPVLQHPWNEYLLESYVYSYSNKYNLIHVAFNKEKPVGGIVRTNSKIKSIEDLLIKVIVENKLFDREKALNYLIENEYILTRKYKDMDTLIEIAKTVKEV